MTSLVSAGEVGRRVIELAGIREGEPFEIALTRDGHVLVGRTEA
jgi:hypothetical protein